MDTMSGMFQEFISKICKKNGVYVRNRKKAVGSILSFIRSTRSVRVATPVIRPTSQRQRVVRMKSTNSEQKASQAQYLLHKESARKLVRDRLVHYVGLYKNQYQIDFSYTGKLSIKNGISRWGSCSSKGNLNFNWRLAMIPSHLADYIVVHELCHLKEFNHGPEFWKLVALACPNYRIYREELKSMSLRI
jgi:predicted metal-dependent hydrolase